jgi:urea transporter
MNASAPADAKICSKASRASACIFVIRGCMFLLSLTATCQVCTVSLKAGLYTYNGVLCGYRIERRLARLASWSGHSPEAIHAAVVLQIWT